MPWCPQCDEVFPEGPACPRCSAPLVDNTAGFQSDETAGGATLPQLKVPRRLERAFGRLNRAPTPPRQLLAFALSMVLLAGGFALGRMSAENPDPTVARPAAGPPLGVPVLGFVDFVRRLPAPPGSVDMNLTRWSMRSGNLESMGRFSSPFTAAAGHEETHVTALEESVALVLRDGQGHSAVGAFPASRMGPLVWIDGNDAAWQSPDRLLVLEDEGAAREWSFGGEITSERLAGAWLRVLQAPDGAVLEGVDAAGRSLFVMTPDGPQRAMAIPEDARTVAVAPGARRALLELDGKLQVWDGVTLSPAGLDTGYEVHGAAFSESGDRVAVTLAERRPSGGPAAVLLAVLDSSGASVMLRRLTAWGRQRCEAVPVWDPSQRWVFVATGDGTIHALEVGGGEVHDADLDNVGCGIARSA